MSTRALCCSSAPLTCTYYCASNVQKDIYGIIIYVIVSEFNYSIPPPSNCDTPFFHSFILIPKQEGKKGPELRKI